MRQFGYFLLLMGVGSSILHFLGREFTLLMWIDSWGPAIGWTIRVGLAVAGAALLAVAAKRTQAATT